MDPRKMVLSVLMVLGLMSGCVSLTGETDQGSDASDSDSEATTESDEPTSLEASDDGGYDDADEEEFFGLDSMEQYGEDEEAEDPSVPNEDDEDTAEEEGTRYVVRIVWGNLELNGDDDEDRGDRLSSWIDWSGSLSYDGEGTLTLGRTILFDRHDSLVDDGDLKAVAWRSYTGPHIDGILAELVVTGSTDETSLTFETDLGTQTVSLSELDRYNEIVTLDEDGHGVAITALQTGDDDCSEGFIAGKFHDRKHGDGGMFRGRVLSEEGALNGHLRGHYGENDFGQKLLFGKYVGESGRFRGFLQGGYGDGAFDGDWVAADGSLEGTFDGKYVTGSDVDSGFFQGFWEEACE